MFQSNGNFRRTSLFKLHPRFFWENLTAVGFVGPMAALTGVVPTASFALESAPSLELLESDDSGGRRRSPKKRSSMSEVVQAG